MVGFRVLLIHPGSPAEKAGLQVMDDFVLSINDHSMKSMRLFDIKKFVESNENKPLDLMVFNVSTHKIRNVTIVPTRNWPGHDLLGMRLREEPYNPFGGPSQQES